MKNIQRSNEFIQCSTLSADIMTRIDALCSEITTSFHASIDQEQISDERKEEKKLDCSFEVTVEFDDGVRATFDSCEALGSSDLLLRRTPVRVSVDSAWQMQPNISFVFREIAGRPFASYSISGTDQSVLSLADRMERIVLASNNHLLWIRKLSITSYGYPLALLSLMLLYLNAIDPPLSIVLGEVLPDQLISLLFSWAPWFLLITTIAVFVTKKFLYPPIEVEFLSGEQTAFQKNRNALGVIATILVSSITSYLLS